MDSMRKTYDMISSLRWNLYEICSAVDVPSDVMLRLLDDLKVVMSSIDDSILKTQNRFYDIKSDEET